MARRYRFDVLSIAAGHGSALPLRRAFNCRRAWPGATALTCFQLPSGMARRYRFVVLSIAAGRGPALPL